MFKFIKNIFGKKDNNIKNSGKNQTIYSEKKEIIFDGLANKVLNDNQKQLKPLLEDFSTTHFLGGGTAIALYLGHRESIDFDFFNNTNQGTFSNFYKRIKSNGFDLEKNEASQYNGILDTKQDEFHFIINNVNFTTFNFFRTLYDDQKILIKGENYILGGLRLASKEELISMKLYAIMTRNKWKDAVDLFFLLKDLNISLKKAINITSNDFFINLIKKENILEQLISANWDKNEKVIYLIDNPPSDHKIENFLKKEALKLVN